MKKMLLVLVVMLTVSALGAFAQETEPDPEVQKAKEATAVVYDLGRFFGFVLTVETDNPKLALTKEQLEDFYEVMREITVTERIEPDWAEENLERLELDVLSPDQLMAIDQLAIARLEGREEESEEPQQKGGGTGSGPILTYIAGGAFNPIIDETKSIGEGFFELFNYIGKKIGR